MFYTQWVLLCPVAGLFKCHPNGRVTQTNKRINSKHLDLIFSVLGIKNKNIKIGQIYIYLYEYTHIYIHYELLKQPKNSKIGKYSINYSMPIFIKHF